MKCAFIGLGVMGYPMAGHLQKAGHAVTVYNRTPSKAEAWVAEFGGKLAATPAAAAAKADVAFCCVGDDNDVRAVTIEPGGILEGLQTGGLLVDHTTASATVAREVAEVASAKGVDFIDAPLSGGQAGAESGQLAIMVGGEPEAFSRALPLLESYAKASTRIGPVGDGQRAKMVNQVCIAGVVQGLSEGLHLAKRGGLDIAAVVGAISKGAAQSWQMENRWETMINDEFEFGFAVEWMRKDLSIALAEAERVGATLDITKRVDGYYADVENLGGGRFDTSSLIKRLEP
ncbi:MAG: NAD(P)-dependent oxidoreductase [Pseudomonadota bacterium]